MILLTHIYYSDVNDFFNFGLTMHLGGRYLIDLWCNW
jgi:hypothetical protein